MVGVNGGIIGGVLRLIAKIILGLFKYLSLAILYAVGGVVLYFATGFNPFSGDLYSILYLIGFGFSVLLSLLIPTYGKGKKGKKDKKSNADDEEDEAPKNFLQRRKARKELALKKAQEEAEAREKEQREEELKEQERRLEELRAERLKEEIAREERLIEEYRRESARATYNRYEETAPTRSAHEETSYFSAPIQRVEYPIPRETTPYAPRVEEEQPQIYMSALEKDVLIHEYSDRFEVYNLVGGEKVFSKVIYKDEK